MQVTYTNQFKKDSKKAKKQHKDFNLILEVVDLLLNKKIIPAKYKDHALNGNYAGHREMHIEPDWLLIYKVTSAELRLVRIGSHSELF